jgi:translation initiation factor 3 subunit I
MTTGEPSVINEALWGSLNHTIISCGDDGKLRVWDTETGLQTNVVDAHKKSINSMQFSKDQTMLITASSDFSAKVWDVKTMQCLKTYTSDRPLNSASISPIATHVIVGGGQEAMHVTTTGAKAGRFETDFYHTVYMEYLGSIKGHFGPINSLAFNPDGKRYIIHAPLNHMI